MTQEETLTGNKVLAEYDEFTIQETIQGIYPFGKWRKLWLAVVSRWHGLISTNFNNNDNDKTRSNRSNESRGKGYAPIF